MRPVQFKTQLEKITQLLPPQAVVPVQDGTNTWQSFKPDPNVTFVWGVKGEYFMRRSAKGKCRRSSNGLSAKRPPG